MPNSQGIHVRGIFDVKSIKSKDLGFCPDMNESNCWDSQDGGKAIG